MRKRKVISLFIILGISIFFYNGIFLDIPRSELEKEYSTDNSSFLKMPDGKIIHFKDEGNPSKTTIVFLNGNNDSLYKIERYIPLLSKAVRRVSIEISGLGLTGPIAWGE
mgnify:CR=1 FL=1